MYISTGLRNKKQVDFISSIMIAWLLAGQAVILESGEYMPTCLSSTSRFMHTSFYVYLLKEISYDAIEKGARAWLSA